MCPSWGHKAVFTLGRIPTAYLLEQVREKEKLKTEIKIPHVISFLSNSVQKQIKTQTKVIK